MKYTLKLNHQEYATLMQMMQLVFNPAPKFREDIEYKLVLCLMQSLYLRMYPKSPIIQRKYSFAVPMAEALAFVLFWTGKPIVDILSSVVVNKIISEINKKIPYLPLTG